MQHVHLLHVGLGWYGDEGGGGEVRTGDGVGGGGGGGYTSFVGVVGIGRAVIAVCGGVSGCGRTTMRTELYLWR